MDGRLILPGCLHPRETPSVSLLQLGLGWFPETHGGAENVFYHLARHLPHQGVAVAGLVLGRASAVLDGGARIDSFAPPTAPLPQRLAAARAAVAAALRRQPPDLVASHFALNTLPALPALRDRPLVVHFHGPWALESAAEGAGALSVRLKLLVERLVYRRATRFVVLSRAFATILTERYGVPPDRISRVPGGVDAGRFDLPDDRAAARARLGWPQGRPVVLTVRRLVRRMGLAALVDAMVELCRRVPDALLLVAGRGPEAAALQDRIGALGLENHVRLLGFVPDAQLPLAYRAADLCVMPSQSLEGFGITALESLAAGTPLLVTPVGGLPEVVEELDGDLVLAGSDARSIGAGLAEALIGSRRMPDAAACRALVRHRFDWPVIAARTAAVYRDTLS
ncbi:glycosyltransferase family 4 protein [Azospirillum picis]|uniref:Glycosyltransferase involved in cell wall biosynthesis n=1 Tax=Azospirillum picis TaxID=488438 RepID=A0ABU0MHQ5_9PROT|nr:glycosyltransferase family 4 protein [Azospirillum picis]MBP2299371.1 glycosyltransferase involved in cell wall biosynthesis [Azospirillum picis]MDQ0532991.1 glycosyltransferase involved in cell wall biosynthesis [Azospirillum picis]